MGQEGLGRGKNVSYKEKRKEKDEWNVKVKKYDHQWTEKYFNTRLRVL